MDSRSIPVRNIYYLLCYAWKQLEPGKVVDISKCPTTELADLFGTTLEQGIRHVLRRGLDQSYRPTSEEIAGIRGRVDMLATHRRLLYLQAKARCDFDELTVNTLANQILRSTLRRICTVDSLNEGLRTRLLALHRDMRGIADLELTPRCFRQVQIHGGNRFYRFLLDICELVYNCWIPEEGGRGRKFRDFVREDRAMARVFESFLFNFVRIECPWWQDVSRDNMNWPATSESDPTLAYLPIMRTDISLRAGDELIIVDAKFYTDTLTGHHGSSKVQSGHLYQLLSYLRSASDVGKPLPGGILVYPEVGQSLDLSYEIWGHSIRVATINLSLEWKEIRAGLLKLFSRPIQQPLAA